MPRSRSDTASHDALTFKEALDRKRDLLERMPPSEVIRNLRLDGSAATGLVIGSLPRITVLRGDVAAVFGARGVAHIDELPIAAYAAEQSMIELAASDAASDMTAAFAGLGVDHHLLLTDADALANRKLIDRSRVDAGRPVQGYRTLVLSTLVLVALMREHWSTVRGKTPLSLEEIDAIEKKAQTLLQRLNERDQGSTRLPAAELRARALSHLVRTYGEVRRMITYVRWWEDDADAIAPSLWTARRRGPRDPGSPEPQEPSEPELPEPQAPVPTPTPGRDPLPS